MGHSGPETPCPASPRARRAGRSPGQEQLFPSRLPVSCTTELGCLPRPASPRRNSGGGRAPTRTRGLTRRPWTASQRRESSDYITREVCVPLSGPAEPLPAQLGASPSLVPKKNTAHPSRPRGKREEEAARPGAQGASRPDVWDPAHPPSSLALNRVSFGPATCCHR